MSLSLLFKDELKGFYKSKVMISLWVGLPVVILLFHLVSPDTGPIPFSTLTAILLASLGGTLASVMITVSIVNEKNGHVYDLFLVRPVRRMDILVAKFFAVYICIAIAALLALAIGFAYDYLSMSGSPEMFLRPTLESFVISLSMLAVYSAVGVLIGVASPSVLVGVILIIFGGNQLSALPMVLPAFLGPTHYVPLTLILGVVLTVILLTAAIVVFNRKKL
ncbi:MAG: hypothetical protein E3J35_05270 [Methanomassiliicoccales archaeon]|nr:MAG: hypothetical protein E3J35_05270 [Methanomassiliicoccales archaeon]